MGSVGSMGSMGSVGSVGSVENPHLTHWTHLTHLTHTASQWQGFALQHKGHVPLTTLQLPFNAAGVNYPYLCTAVAGLCPAKQRPRPFNYPLTTL